MDPVSGVASIFAIISLAVQLAETAVGLKTFIDSIIDAPVEVRRLKSSISLLIKINDNINYLLDRQRRQGLLDHRLIQSIHESLKFCRDKLDLIKNVTDLANTAEKNASPALRGWAHIKLACKKNQLEDFTNQLDQAITVLGTNLAINSSHLQLTTISNITQFSNQLTILSNTLVSEKLRSSALADKLRNEKRQSSKSFALLPLSNAKSLPGVYREWRGGSALQLRYCQIGGEHIRYSISAIIQVYGTRVVRLQLNVPDLRQGLLSCSLLNVRSLIAPDAAIIIACKAGDSTVVKQLLGSKKARPNDVTLDHCTALSTAIQHDQHEIAQLLLQTGADPNLPAGQLQDSPIQIAVAHNNLQMVRLLMRYDADLQYCSAKSWSILHYLFHRDESWPKDNYYSIFWDDLVFDDIRDPQGWTAMHRCAAFGTAEDIYMLVKLGASSFTDRYITTWGRAPFHIAALMNNVSTLQAMSDLAGNEYTGRNGDAQQHAIFETADVNGWTPLHLAVHSRAMDTVKWLLGKKVDVHKRTYQTAIWFPENRTNETFSVIDVANLAGEKMMEAFSFFLIDAGYDITIDGGDIYW